MTMIDRFEALADAAEREYRRALKNYRKALAKTGKPPRPRPALRIGGIPGVDFSQGPADFHLPFLSRIPR